MPPKLNDGGHICKSIWRAVETQIGSSFSKVMNITCICPEW
jgi:hypothetical protein